MGLFIDQFIPSFMSPTGDIPSTVKIIVPEVPSVGSPATEIVGISEGDVSFQLQNQFSSLLPDLTILQDMAAIMNTRSFPSWISASGQTWRGTEPIRIEISMYVINWAPDLGHEEKLEILTKFCTVTPVEDSLTNVVTHGGYAPDLLQDNMKTFFDNDVNSKKSVYGGMRNTVDFYENMGKIMEDEANARVMESELLNVKARPGLITLKVGHHITITNLLLTRLSVTPSIVEVKGLNDNDPKPLYYRISASFQTSKVALASQVAGLYGLDK